MGFATFSYDLASQSPAAPTISEALQLQLAPLTTWRLLSGLWMIEFPSIAAFEAFGAALETLHEQHRNEFDYFALHFEPSGGPVVIAPNPAVRQPAPRAALRAAAPVRAGVQSATVTLDDPRAVLSQLRDLHASIAREDRIAPGARSSDPHRRGGSRRRRGRALGRGARGSGKRKGAGGAASRKRASKRRR